MRRSIVSVLLLVSLCGASGAALAQNYLLAQGKGRAETIQSCEKCHGVEAFINHKRSSTQWDEVMQQMITIGLQVNDAQKHTILAYLKSNYGQSQPYVPAPPPLRGRGPGLALALEAAQAAAQYCKEQKNADVATLVVDSTGATLVELLGDGVPPVLAAIAKTKTATVLKFKESSGAVMGRLEQDPALAEQLKNDPEIGQVRQGGLPIVVGNELIGAIAVSGAFGPANTDEICAKAGLDRIAPKLH